MSRSTAQDYWNVNWGPVKAGPGGGGAAAAASSSAAEERLYNNYSSSQSGGGGGGGSRERQEPLPTVPVAKPSPILGTEVEEGLDGERSLGLQKEEEEKESKAVKDSTETSSRSNAPSYKGDSNERKSRADDDEDDDWGFTHRKQVQAQVHIESKNSFLEPLYGVKTDFSLPRISLDHSAGGPPNVKKLSTAVAERKDSNISEVSRL